MANIGLYSASWVLLVGLCISGLTACDRQAEHLADTVARSEVEPSPVTSSQALNRVELGLCWFELPAERLVECGHYRPKDFDKAELPFVILRNNRSHKTSGVIMYLPGGPGSSSYLTEEGIKYWSNWYEQSQLQLDLVLVDRRGVGLATPYWSCSDYDRFSRQVLARDLTLAEEMAAGYKVVEDCYPGLRQAGYASELFSTRQSAADIGALLTSLDYSQWNLLGVSYGTRLALAVAESYPENVSSLVLDSLYTPEQGQLTDWPEILDGAFHRFFGACESFSDCESPQAIQAIFWQVLHQLKQAPVSITVPSWYSDAPYHVLVNDQRLLGIIFGSLYDRYLYPDIIKALNELVQYRTSSLSQLVETYVNNAFDPSFNDWVFYAVECRDNPRVTADRYREAVLRFPKWRVYTESLQEYDICNLIDPNGLKGNFNGERDSVDETAIFDIPVLLLAGELDPITPAAAAKTVLQKFGTAQGVFVRDYGHAIESSLPCGPELVGGFILHPHTEVNVMCAEAEVIINAGREK